VLVKYLKGVILAVNSFATTLPPPGWKNKKCLPTGQTKGAAPI
jgi:hypothetical protein